MLPVVPAIRLEGHDEPENKQYALQNQKHAWARLGGTPLVLARRKHPEQPQEQRKPARQGDQYALGDDGRSRGLATCGGLSYG